MIKFGFVTCVQLGFSCMEAIYDLGGKLDLAITLCDDQAPNKSGRVYVDDFCNENKIPLLKSRHINDPIVVDTIKNHQIDWLFIIGWSQIASVNILNAPSKGVLGIHPTMLPVGRGRASIPWAIIKGLDATGITMFKLDEGVDTGPIVDQINIPISSHTDATALYGLVNEAHITLIKKVFPSLKQNSVVLSEQDESLASEWPGRKPEDGLIDLNDSVIVAERLVRALTKPYPGAFFYKDNKKTLVHKARIVSKDNAIDNFLDFVDGRLQLIEFEEINEF